MSEATMRPGCNICDLPPSILPEYRLLEDTYWTASIGLDQTFLGCTHVTLNRHASELDELLPAEDESFRDIRNALIHAVRSSFRPITFNVSCLKNGAFRDSSDHTPAEAAHVYWDIVPRYGAQPRIFNGETFADPNPGRDINNMHKRHFAQPETLRAIAAAICSNLPGISREPTPRTL